MCESVRAASTLAHRPADIQLVAAEPSATPRFHTGLSPATKKSKSIRDERETSWWRRRRHDAIYEANAINGIMCLEFAYCVSYGIGSRRQRRREIKREEKHRARAPFAPLRTLSRVISAPPYSGHGRVKRSTSTGSDLRQ